METPFGPDENDVDVDKLTRRIDKHTAALVGLWAGKPAVNYDVYPDTNSKHASRLGRQDSLYSLPTSPSKPGLLASSRATLVGVAAGTSASVVSADDVKVEGEAE